MRFRTPYAFGLKKVRKFIPKKISKVFISLCMILPALLSQSQIQSLRCFQSRHQSEILLTEKYFIEPQSISILNTSKNVQVTDFNFDPILKKISIAGVHFADSLKICYRVFPLSDPHRIFLYDNQLRSQALAPDYARDPSVLQSKLNNREATGIQYSGSFTRGISSGNNQSLVLNSNLNLQLSGNIGDGISISGAISDNQIPIQPDGNTRQIQEFDRLYLRLSKNKHSLTAGDFEVAKPEGYFMNYFKKNKGGLLETQFRYKDWEFKNKTAFAISKGKSNRLTLKTQNGNQGPYRLFGNAGEMFIVVLAGSEKVWLDGRLLQRGETENYIIDYNLAEIRFMPGTLVSDQSRVIIEFEYLDQTYTRILILNQTQASHNNRRFYLNIFNEQDSKQAAVESDLDSLDRSILESSGDMLNAAVRSGIQTAGLNYNINRVYYRQRDTLIFIQGIPQQMTFLYFDPLADSSALQVRFSEVSPGLGQYVLKESTANGRVYEWISPDPLTGANRGLYEPVVALIAPASQFMITGGFQLQGKSNAELSGELALSSFDKNRLSPLQDDDNRGTGMKLSGRAPDLFLLDSNLVIKTQARYEYVHQNFKTIQPFRTVEFERDWNLAGQPAGTDHYPEISCELLLGKKISLDYLHSRLFRSGFLKGHRNVLQTKWSHSLTNVRLVYNQMRSEDPVQLFGFFRPSLEVIQHFKNGLQAEFRILRERNEKIKMSADSLQAGSFSFDVAESKLQKRWNPNAHSLLSIKFRSDHQPDKRSFSAFSKVYELGWETFVQNHNSGEWDFKIAARKTDYSNPQLDDSLSQVYFIGALDHRLKLLKNTLQIRNYYELQSGVEPRQEFVFEERKPGEGQFIFIDFNKDNIRQVYEYVYAPDIDTARFVRFQLFNSEYQQIYQSSWNQTLNMDFKSFKKEHQKYLNFLRSFSLESSVRFNSKANENSKFSDRMNPLLFLSNTLNTIAYQSFMRQSLYFNRGHAVFEFQLAYAHNSQKMLLTSGTDEKSTKDPHLKSRFTLKRNVDLLLEGHLKEEKRNSEFYADQNFKVKTISIMPGVIYRIHKNLRLQLITGLRNIREEKTSDQLSQFYDCDLSLAAFLLKKLSLRAQFYYLHANYSGTRGSLAEYTLLQGFGDGDNFSWNLQADYKISTLMQLQFSYNGRKAAGSEPLHTVRMQLQAHF